MTGKKEEAIRRFEQILGITTEFRDVAEFMQEISTLAKKSK